MRVALMLMLSTATDAIDVPIGRSTEPWKTVSIRDTLPAGVTDCHPYPANECCGHLFTHTLDTDRGRLTINRTDHLSGWAEELHWECATETEPEMHLPVGFHLVPAGGANCHVLRDPQQIWANARFDSDDWHYTTQINMRIFCTWNNGECDHTPLGIAPARFQRFLNLTMGSNWHGAWKSSLRITTPGRYTFVKQIGYAESAISFLNGQEMFRSRCREPLVSTVLTLAAGVYSLNIYQMDDGWEDALAMMYQGPDSGNQLVIIPSNRFMRPCLPSEWADPAANFRCVSRPSPFNARTGGCDDVDGENYIVSTAPDENCVQCETDDDHIHRCVDGVHAPLTTQFRGTWFSRATQVPETLTHAAPVCDGCGYRIKACGPPINNTWDVDYIQFRNDNQGIDMSHYEAQPISSGWDYGENHDYHYMSYAPEQAFRSNFNLWRGKANDAGEYYIGIRSDLPITVDSVQFSSGRCSDRSITWWDSYNARRVEAGRGIYVHNYTRCVQFEKWDGSSWVTVGRQTAINPCQLYTLNMNSDSHVVQCPGTTDGTLGNGVCNPNLNTLSCNFDMGDCRTCRDALPAIGNGSYTMLNGSTLAAQNSTLGMVAEVGCNTGFMPSRPGAVAVCNASTEDFNAQASWAWDGGAVPTCGPLRCLPNATVTDAVAASEGLEAITDLSSVLVGQTATFRCSEHHELVGRATIACVRYGDGGVLQHTVPSCVQLECDADVSALATPTNGAVSAVDTVSGGDGVTFECDPGYTMVGPATVTCAQMQWSGPAPTCQPKQCTASVSIPDGVVAVTSRDFGSDAPATCNHGFLLSDLEMSAATCALTPGDGDGDGSVSWQNMPTCEPITCEVPARPTGEIRSIPSRTGTIGFGDQVRYSCEAGWALSGGPVAYECGATDGDFENPPICVAIVCTMPAISAPNMSISHANDTVELFVGDSIDLSCVDGWRSYPATASFDCAGQQSPEGQWLPRTPSINCQYIPLPRPPDLAYANLNVLSQETVNAEAADPGSRFTPGTSEVIYDCLWGGSTMIFQIQENRTWAQVIGECPLYEPTPPPTTATPTEEASSGATQNNGGESDSAADSSTTLIAVVAGVSVVVVLVIVGAVCFVKKATSAAESRAGGASSFENPMYASAPNEQTYAEVGDNNSGYMDVPGSPSGGGYAEPKASATTGYMDVAPQQQGFDSDEEEV